MLLRILQYFDPKLLGNPGIISDLLHESDGQDPLACTHMHPVLSTVQYAVVSYIVLPGRNAIKDHLSKIGCLFHRLQ